MKKTYLFLGVIILFGATILYFFNRRQNTTIQQPTKGTKAEETSQNSITYINTQTSNETLEISLTASDSIEKGQIVAISGKNATVYLPQNQDLDELSIGIAKNNATAGQNIKVAIAGVVSGFSNLESGKTYFAGQQGSITEDVPENGMLRSIGVALSSTELVIDFSQKIILQ